MTSSVSRFGPFTLDACRAALARDGTSVPLRPKTFALLSYLAGHPGRVLGKDELLGAVWPGVVVNEESLSQCVRELRAALGKDGPALIKTIARRGYLFDAVVQVAAPSAPSAPHESRWAGWTIVATVMLASVTLAVQLPDRSTEIDRSLKTHRSIAVMPFGTSGADGLGDRAEAIAEDLITDLAKLPDTLVVAQASAAAPRARHVLSGSVRSNGSALQVNVQVASSEDGAVLWSGRFDELTDIGTRVAAMLDVRLTTSAAARSAAQGRQRPDAIDETLQGQLGLRNFVSRADLLRTRAHFEKALAIEPDSAAALTGLAQSYLSEVEANMSLGVTGLALAEQFAARALAADPDYLPAQCLIGHLLRERGDFEGALRVYQKVLAGNPSDAWTHARIGTVKLRLGRPEEVAAHVDAALRLSPSETALLSYGHFQAGVAEYYLGREDAAYERMRRAAAAGPSRMLHAVNLWMAALDALYGRGPEAREHAAHALRLRPYWTIHLWRIGTAPVHPGLQRGRERFDEGLQLAGLPE